MSATAINSVAIVVKPDHPEALRTANELAEWLQARGIRVTGEPYADPHSLVADADAVPSTDERFDADLIVVLGGDGTMISTARLIGDRQVLVLGINHGSLGYLTEFRIEEMLPAIGSILDGEYAVDSRMMLRAGHFRDDDLIADGRVLNEVVINKTALARMIRVDVSLDGRFVNSFRADGLIVATPTGSTAYNLSAGGPIVYPSMNAVVLTPICPFTLTNRPIVIPDSSEIELTLTDENGGVALTLDGQIGYSMNAGDRVIAKKSRTTFNIVQPSNRNYFDVLRDKLKWGR